MTLALQFVPVAEGTANEHVAWSVMIPTYEPTVQLREAIESVQAACPDRGGMQIEVVDDCSPTVDVASLLASWGLASVRVHRRSANGGLGACWNECIQRATGTLVHILHQDDLVKPLFYARMGELAARAPTAGMYFCRTEFLDERGPRLGELEQPNAGVVDGWLEKIAAGQRLQCPSVVVRRETYRRVGLFEPSLRYVIDWEMWVRIAARVDVAYLPDALAVYRIHESAESRKIKSAGIATADMGRGLRFIRRSLEDAGRLDCFARAQQFAVNASTWAAQEAEGSNDRPAAIREVTSALRYLSGAMAWRRRFQHVRWYLRLRFPRLRTIGRALRP